MTSKNSFWASIKENNKRRIWLWLLSALGYVIVFPTMAAMSLSRTRTSGEYLIETMGEALGQKALYDLMVKAMEEIFGITNPIGWIAVTILAVVSAIQGFGYLYHKRKIDFYMGIPVKRSRRFLVIWMNGIVVYLLPYAAGILLGWLVAAGNGVMTVSVFKETMLAFGLYLCFYLGVYHLTILAVMLTGNVIITCFGTAVFFLYEWAVRVILTGYKEMFFKFFSYQSDAEIPILSPFSILIKYVQKHEAGTGNGFVTACYLLMFSAVVGGIAYVCYRKRPAEAAGKAMAFQLPQPFIKVFITVPVALLAGLIASDTVGYTPLYGEGSAGFVIFVMAVVLIVVCCVIQVIYEFDIKGMLHKKHHILISAAAVALVFIIFRYDVFGYDSYLPSIESVSSAAIIPPYEYSYYGGEFFYDEELNTVSKDDYVMENMYITDVGVINKLLKKSIDTVNQYENLNQLYSETAEDARWYRVKIIYRMGNKRNVRRSILVNVKDPEVVELLDRIESSDEYICGIYPGTSETLAKILADENAKISVYYGNNIYQQKISLQEASELLSLYKEDIKGTSFSMFRENVNTGSLRVSIEKKKVNYTSYYDMEIKIYPFFSRCVEYLKERGYYMDSFVEPEDVERILVANYHYELERQYQEQLDGQSMTAEERLAMGAMAAETIYGMESSDFTRYASYEDKASIQELCEKIYPVDWIGTSWHSDVESAENYRVTIYFKPESEAKIGGNGASLGSFSFMADEVPEFVERDTAYEK